MASCETRPGSRAIWNLQAGLFAWLFLLAASTPAWPQQSPQLVPQIGHLGHVLALDVAANGKWLVTGGEDRVVIVWEVETGNIIRRFEGHEGAVTSVRFSGDCLRIVSGSLDETARIWDITTGSELRRFTSDRPFLDKVLEFESKPNPIHSVGFSRDGRRVYVGDDYRADIWNLDTGKREDRFGRLLYGVVDLAVSSDDRLVALAQRGDAVFVFDARSGERLKTFEGHKGQARCLTFDRTTSLLAVGSEEGEVVIYDVASERAQQRILCQKGAIRSVEFSPDARTLAIGFTNGTLQLRDYPTGRLIRELEHLKPAEDENVTVAFSADGRMVFAAANYGVFGWDLEAPESMVPGELLERRLKTASRTFYSFVAVPQQIAFSADRRLLALRSSAQIFVWNISDGALIRTIVPENGFLVTMAFSSAANRLAYAETSGRVTVLDAQGGMGTEQSRVSTLTLSNPVNALAWAEKDKTIVAATKAGLFRWRLEESEARRMVGGEASDWELAVSPSQKYLLYSPHDELFLLDAETQSQWKSGRHKYSIRTMKFNRSGTMAATGGWFGELYCWDIPGLKSKRLKGDEADITDLDFDPTGRTLVSAAGDGTIRIWNVASGKTERFFRGHTGGVTSVGFSADGGLIWSASFDGTTRLWDVASGKELAKLVMFPDSSWAVVDSAGRFDVSDLADFKGLSWVVGTETIELRQLKQRYYDPGLLPKSVGRSADLRQVEAFGTPQLCPDVEVEEIDSRDPVIRAHFKNRGGGIGKVIVRINGREIADDARGSDTSVSAATFDLSVPIANHPLLRPGENNEVEIHVYNGEGYLSNRGIKRVVHIPASGSLPKPKLWAIIVGVSDYGGDRIDLRFAGKDAVEMATAIDLGARRLFEDRVHIQVLANDFPPGARSFEPQAPTKVAIRRAFESIRAAEASDLLVVYLAGHGVALGETYYFLTMEARETDLSDPEVRSRAAVSSDELFDWLPHVTKEVLILDTCAAGAAQASFSKARNSSDDQIRAIERLKDRSGFHVLMGSAADAVSYEASRYEQGVLTVSLLQGMRGPALREEQFVDVNRLFQYAREEVPSLAQDIGGIQKPRIFAPRPDSFDIGLLTMRDRALIRIATAKPQLVRPTFFDPLKSRDELQLSSKVAAQLRNEAYASARGGGRSVPGIFRDSTELPGGVLASGIYTIQQGKIILELRLFRDDQLVGQSKIEAEVEDIDTLVKKVTESIWKGVASLPHPDR